MLVDGGVRTPADGIVTPNLAQNTTAGTEARRVLWSYVFRHHTMTIFIRDDTRGVDLIRDVSRCSRTVAAATTTFVESGFTH